MPQVWSRTQASASALAEALQAEPVVSTADITTDADVYVFAVKDAVLESLVHQVCGRIRGKVFLHTAGSMPIELFANHTQHYGVFYPMQTFSKSRVLDFSEIPVFVEASDEVAQMAVSTLAGSVSKHVTMLSSEQRRYLHLAAVFACNFSNHCYALAEQVLAEQGIPFSVMLPLIDETVRKVHQMSPREAQTGPAVRYDENVLSRHAELLENHPEWKKIYEIMSKNIHQLNS